MMTEPDINIENLTDWLQITLGSQSRSVSLEKFKGGQSNPTYKVGFDGADYVVRRKPFGDLLPSAHAVDREFQIIKALHPTGFAVPKPVALCQDPDVIGVDFYLMEFVEGRIYRHTHMPEAPPEARRKIYTELAKYLTELHKVDFKAAGLGDFERSGNYFERQIKRWTKQYRASQTDDVPAIDALIEYLSGSVPAQTRTAIIHGDYTIKNVSFDNYETKVNAVLDWELTTIGDPLADLTYCTMYWVMPPDDPFSLATINHKETGIPALEEMQQFYAEAAGLSDLPPLDWHYAFNLFRLVGIFQGIKKRAIAGNASSSQTAEIVSLIPALAEGAMKIVRNTK